MSDVLDKIIIAPTKLAILQANAVRFQARAGNMPVRISATGLATTEEVEIYFSNDNGATFVRLSQENGEDLSLTATLNIRKLTAPGVYGFGKLASAADVTVFAFGG